MPKSSSWMTDCPTPHVRQEDWHDVLDKLESAAATLSETRPFNGKSERIIATISGPDGSPIEVILR